MSFQEEHVDSREEYLHPGVHIQNICGGMLFDLGPTFMFISDKCTDVYPSFLQVPKPTQLKIQM